jgi:type I restriction enzyme S subunit
MSELPETWAETTVADFVAVHDNRRIPLNAKQREEMKGGYPYFGANGLVDHINDFLFDGDYTLLAEDGGYFDDPKRGVAYEASGKFWVNNHAHILEALGGVTNRFLRYALNSVNWMPFVGGSTRLKLTQGGLQQAMLPIPPLAEQRRIETKVDSLHTKSRRAHDHLDHIPRLVEKYKQAILVAAFRGELIVPMDQSEFRPHAFSEAVVSTFYGPRIASTAYVERGIPTLRTTDIGDWGRIIPKSPPQVRVSETDFDKWGFRHGDLMITRTGATIGKCAVYEANFGRALPSAYLIRVRLNLDMMDPRFAVLFLLSPSGRQQLLDGRTAVAQPNINARMITSIKLPIPTRRTQEQIVKGIETAFTWIDHIASQTSAARKLISYLDQAILAKAFRGELVPQVPNDEPASALLERIRTERDALAKKSRGRVGSQNVGRKRAQP